MKIQIKKVVRPLDLADFAPEYDAVIWIWVNPTRAKIMEREEIRGSMELAFKSLKETKEDDVDKLKKIAEKISENNTRFYGWLAEIWSQGKESETHWTQEEVKVLAEALIEDEPALWTYIQTRTFEMFADHRESHKKKLN